MGEATWTTRGWSWEENKAFELALAARTARTDENDPTERWKEIASVLGGERSAEEVEEHYNALLADLGAIESGGFDHELYGSAGTDPMGSLTDEDMIQFAQVNIE